MKTFRSTPIKNLPSPPQILNIRGETARNYRSEKAGLTAVYCIPVVNSGHFHIFQYLEVPGTLYMTLYQYGRTRYLRGTLSVRLVPMCTLGYMRGMYQHVPDFPRAAPRARDTLLECTQLIRGFKRKSACVHIITFRVTTRHDLLPDCSQNQTAVSDSLRLLSDF